MIFKNKLKTAIVTGSTRGVGKEIAKMFLKNNYNVVITGRNINDALNVADELNSKKNTKAYAKGFYLNYDNIHNSSKLLNSLENKEIIPNFLINNAGALNTRNLDNISLKTIDILTRTNMIGPLIMSKYCIDIVKNKDEYGGILFNIPPYIIDDKTTYLLPYMQTKLAQTTFMKSLANSNLNNKALICGFWTNYPLSTDAIINRNIGSLDNCMHPSILSDTLEHLIFKTENPWQHNSKVIIDGDFLNHNNISIDKYKMGENIKKLDELFMNHLIKKYKVKKNLY